MTRPSTRLHFVCSMEMTRLSIDLYFAYGTENNQTLHKAIIFPAHRFFVKLYFVWSSEKWPVSSSTGYILCAAQKMTSLSFKPHLKTGTENYQNLLQDIFCTLHQALHFVFNPRQWKWQDSLSYFSCAAQEITRLINKLLFVCSTENDPTTYQAYILCVAQKTKTYQQAIFRAQHRKWPDSPSSLYFVRGTENEDLSTSYFLCACIHRKWPNSPHYVLLFIKWSLVHTVLVCIHCNLLFRSENVSFCKKIMIKAWLVLLKLFYSFYMKRHTIMPLLKQPITPG